MLALSLILAITQQSPEAAADATLAKMTVEEKLAYIGGEDSMYIRAIPRLGLPRIKMSDGPVGVRTWGSSTAYPAGVCLSATFDPELTAHFGAAIGHDARARGVNIWLAPGVNLARAVQNGRNFEYEGEDPYLTATNAAIIVKSVQAQGVSTTVKHFAANDHEDDRNHDSSEVDERTLREIYLRPFQAAVEAGSGCAMCGYNKLNGVYCSENSWLLQRVLREDWHFDGVLMSDWGAAHSTLNDFKNGLDLEMPDAHFMSPANLKPLLDDGQITTAQLDEKVRRILRLIYRFHWTERPQLDDSIPKDDPASAEVALQIAREGTVLLKNDGILPLSRAKTHRVVVLGPGNRVTGGGGSSITHPFHSIAIDEAIKQVGGDGVTVTYHPVIGKINEAFQFRGYEGPLKAEYFIGKTLAGAPVLTREEKGIDYEWGGESPGPGVPGIDFSTRWTGAFKAAEDGVFLFAGRSDDGIRVWIDDQLMLDSWVDRGATTDTFRMTLKKGQIYRLKVEFYQGGGDAVAKFGMLPVEAVLHQSLPVDEIKKADAVVLAVGFDEGSESEGFDRPYALPAEQRLMLDSVMKLSKHTIVVNHSGAAIDTKGWIDHAGAFIQGWYPGENGNQALAEILFGDTNPSGKLCVTFPRDIKGTYYESAYPPKAGKIVYNEGLFMGYRWFDKNDVKPLFPFGFGLSYTTFKLGHASVQPTGDGVNVSVDVTNIGSRRGSEVLQLYAAKFGSSVPRAVRELKGYQRVELNAGETKPVALHLSVKDLAYWDVAAQKWVVEAGRNDVWVGTSSRDLPVHITYATP